MEDDVKKMMRKIEENSHISIDDIYRIAQSVQHADFSDEMTIRHLVRQLAMMANRQLSREKEEQIVRSILNNQMPSSLDELQRYFD